MKKMKLGMGIAAFGVAVIMAFATTPNANANKYWRFTPGQTQITPDQCPSGSSTLCANIYNDAGTQLVGTVNGTYTP